MKTSITVDIISILLMILFLYTGISKLTDHATFSEQLAGSPILKPVAPLIAWLIPSVEFLITVLLILPRWRLSGLYASLALISIFTIYVITLVSINDKLPCSCGGIIGSLSWPQHILVNSVFIVLSIIAIILQKRIKLQGELNNTWLQSKEMIPVQRN